MKPVEFGHGTVEIDASVIAEGLGIALPLLRNQMRAGKITSQSERGVDDDIGRYRLTFFSEHRRFRVVVDANGAILQRSTLNFGDSPLPKSLHRPGG
ncbi:MAG: DUF6522 family protein [Bradyrhizobium sp.]|uniref:DUF6522 family protein n=1 Tax=Bradyrhizobium sp. TaxID=376 RepID=UPI00271DACB1|nr:DUF6522 family protein [Bradyrhizobium sp.]MDO9560965.1 DUF6522 family protein [Bradyrhizobium sp.]MDP3694266.1 DUF6522 family protein [Bradyrhizobium sp.]